MKPATRSNIFKSPALPLLRSLVGDHGFALRLVGNDVWVKPLDRLTDVQRDQIRQQTPALRPLLAIFDDGTQERLAIFKKQFTVAPADSIPAFLFRDNVPYVKGSCFSCSAGLLEIRYGRCQRCSLAWRLAVGVDIPAELAAAVDEARVA